MGQYRNKQRPLKKPAGPNGTVIMMVCEKQGRDKDAFPNSDLCSFGAFVAEIGVQQFAFRKSLNSEMASQPNFSKQKSALGPSKNNPLGRFSKT